MRQRGEEGEDRGGGDEVEHGVVDEMRAWGGVAGWVGGRGRRAVRVRWGLKLGGGDRDIKEREGNAEVGLGRDGEGVGAEGEGCVVA